MDEKTLNHIKEIEEFLASLSNSNNQSKPKNYTGTTVNGVSYDSSGKAKEDSNQYYSEILANLGKDYSSLEELYNAAGLGLSGNNMSTEQREDFLKQLIDSMFAKKQLDEQRAYDDPTSLLGRLLATGMSKDSALQLLAGASGSGSGGSALIGAANSPAPSESFANEVGAKTSIANTALNALQCAASVASFGVALPSQIANNTIATTSAKITQGMQTTADSVSAANAILDSAVQNGQIDPATADEASSGSQTLQNAMSYLADKYPDSPAAQFVQSPQFADLQSPYAPKVTSDMYRDKRSGSDYSSLLAHEFVMRRAAERLSSIDIDTASEELVGIIQQNKNAVLEGMIQMYNLEHLSPAQLENLLLDATLKRSQISLNAQEMALFGVKKKNLQSVTALNFANAKYTSEQSRALKLSNDLNDEALEWKLPFPGHEDKLMSGRTWLTQGMCAEYADQALAHYGLLSPEMRNKYAIKLQQDTKFNAVNSTFKYLYYSDFLKDYRVTSPATKSLIFNSQLLFHNPFTGAPTGAEKPLKAAGSAGVGIGTLLKIMPK